MDTGVGAPKQQPRERGGANPLLTVPLLVLLTLNGRILLNLSRSLAERLRLTTMQLGVATEQ